MTASRSSESAVAVVADLADGQDVLIEELVEGLGALSFDAVKPCWMSLVEPFKRGNIIVHDEGLKLRVLLI